MFSTVYRCRQINSKFACLYLNSHLHAPGVYVILCSIAEFCFLFVLLQVRRRTITCTYQRSVRLQRWKQIIIDSSVTPSATHRSTSVNEMIFSSLDTPLSFQSWKTKENEKKQRRYCGSYNTEPDSVSADKSKVPTVQRARPQCVWVHRPQLLQHVRIQNEYRWYLQYFRNRNALKTKQIGSL